MDANCIMLLRQAGALIIGKEIGFSASYPPSPDFGSSVDVLSTKQAKRTRPNSA